MDRLFALATRLHTSLFPSADPMTVSRHAPRALALPALALLMVAALVAVPDAARAQTPVTTIENTSGDVVLESYDDGALLAPYVSGANAIPAEGDGTRMMWYPGKAAFRAGDVDGSQWDDSNIGYWSVAFGYNTTASYNNSVAMGEGTTASGDDATAMGNSTIASGNQSTAMGRRAKAEHDGTFVWGDNTDADFSSTAPKQFLVRAGGGVGMGTNTPQTQLDVRRDVSGAASIGNHVAFLENPATSSGDVLALKSNASDPGSGVNFISFKDADGAVGAIEGTNNGGVTLTSGSADFAEELPVEKGAEAPRPAEIVGVEGGTVSRKTDGADQVMIASRAPVLTGNATPANKADDARRVAVAFIGQVPAKVQGPAQPGDLIVPSGKEDGTARAVSPENYRRVEHGPIAGQAWARKTSEDVGEVTVAVGPGRSGAVAEHLEEQRKTNQKQRAQIENLEKRLAALEAEASAAPATAGLTGSPAGSWGLALLLGLGGLAGGSMLWQRRS